MRIRCKLFFKPNLFKYWFLTVPGWHKIIFCIPSIIFDKPINLIRIFLPLLLSFCTILLACMPMSMTSMRLVHCVSFRLISIDQKDTGVFFAFVIQNLNIHHVFPTMSAHFVMNVFTCFYGLCLNPLTGAITKFCVPTIKHLLRRV